MADDKQDDLEAGEAAGGGKKKLIIIISAVALLLIGGGVAAWFLLSGGDEAPTDQAQAKAEEAPPPQAEQGPAQYVDLKPVLVANLASKRPKMVQMGLQVRVYSQAMADFLKNNDPMIRNDLLNLLGTQDGKVLLTRKGKEDLRAAIKKVLARIGKRYRAPGKVDEVFFSSFVLQ